MEQGEQKLSNTDVDYVHLRFNTRSREIRDFYKLRYKVFVEELGWDLPSIGRYERDQYDQETAEYVLGYRDGVMVAGCRMHPTMARIMRYGQEHSYMIADAANGVLDGMPTDIMEAPPASPDIWELSRVISPSSPAEFRRLMWAVRCVLRERNVSKSIFITRPVIKKICATWGYDVLKEGPVKSYGAMKAQAVLCDITKARITDQLRDLELKRA